MKAAQASEAGEGARNWYDAVWLDKYIEATAIVTRVAPARLDEFVHAFAVLRPPPGYSRQRFVPGFLSPRELDDVRDTIRRIPMVLGAERFAPTRVPHHQRVFAVDVPGTLVTPSLECPQDQFGIGSIAQARAECQQLGAQFVGIGKPAVHHQHRARVVVRQRLALLKRFGGCV